MLKAAINQPPSRQAMLSFKPNTGAVTVTQASTLLHRGDEIDSIQLKSPLFMAANYVL